MSKSESICRKCFHSYVCEQFNEHREWDNKKCHFANDHFISADIINCLQAENERLTIRLRKAEHQLDDLCIMHNVIKAEAYKEFAKKLESIIMWSPKNHISITAKDVRNILQELVGDDK